MKIEIYIGEKIEHESERVVLRSILASLTTSNISSIIISNVNLNNRQLDFIIATENLVLVIEAKKSNRPIRGSKNGPWEFKASTGDWRTLGRNYYNQTLGAKYALRDAMQSFANTPSIIPEAALIFSTSISKEDVPESDFKVHIGGLELLQDLEKFKKNNNWSLDKWRAFVHFHNLINIKDCELAFDDRLLDAQFLLESYSKSFSEFYRPQSEALVSFSCHYEGETTDSDAFVCPEIKDNLLILGPSGCGKSMFAKLIASKQLSSGVVPIFVEAKYFQNDFGFTLNREASLLGLPSAKVLLQACRLLKSKIMVIIDGFNECNEDLRLSLSRSLMAIAIRTHATLLVTSQYSYPELDQLNLRRLDVPEPSIELKRKIAKISDANSEPNRIGELLCLARTGLEATILGKISDLIVNKKFSRYILFDTYVRRLLGDIAQEGVRVLSGLASYFTQHITFSISVRELDRQAESYQWSLTTIDHLVKLRLLDIRNDRISFGHELYLSVYSTEAIVRAYATNADLIHTALSSPIHAGNKNLIIGAIEDEILLENIFNGIEDPEIFVSCIMGECGEYASEWACARFNTFFGRMRAESAQVTFAINESAWMKVEAHSTIIWSKQEISLMQATSILLDKGFFLDEVFEIVGVIDKAIKTAHNQLVDEAREKRINLRSALFAAGIDDQNSNIAISRIISIIGHHFSYETPDLLSIANWVKTKFLIGDASDGQHLMLIKISRRNNSAIIGNLTTLIEQHWQYAPYHLRLEILHSASFCGQCDDNERERLLDAVQSIETNNIFLSSAIVDALKSLGGLEYGSYEETVKKEIAEVLAYPNNPDSWSRARQIYLCQFDHPYDGDYWHVLHELAPDQYKNFLIMAVRAKDNSRMFSSAIVIDLALLEDKTTAKYIEHWTDLPPNDSPIPQDAVEVFVISHIVLGLLQHRLEPKSFNGLITENAMLACGEIYYLLNQETISEVEKASRANSAWEILMQHEQGVALSILMECENCLKEGLNRFRGKQPTISLLDAFPDELLELSRYAILNRTPQRGRNPWVTHDQILNFAVSILGHVGRKLDRPLLRKLVDDQSLGKCALKALKNFEARLEGTK